MIHETKIGHDEKITASEQDMIKRGKKLLNSMKEGQQRSTKMWNEFVPILKKHFPSEQQQQKFRNPSGDYSVDRIIAHFNLSPQELRSFVDDCSHLFESYGRYARASELWGAVYKKKMFIGSALKECQRLYDSAVEEELYGEALDIAESDVYLTWFRGTKSGVGLDNLTRALEEHAKDVLAALKLTHTPDPVDKVTHDNIHRNYLQPLFLDYMFTKDEHNGVTLYRMRTDGYASDHPSETAIEIAKQYCNDEAERGVYGMLFARGDAKKARLDVHDPEYFKELMKKTALAERIKVKLKTMFEKRNEKRSLARE